MFSCFSPLNHEEPEGHGLSVAQKWGSHCLAGASGAELGAFGLAACFCWGAARKSGRCKPFGALKVIDQRCSCQVSVTFWRFSFWDTRLTAGFQLSSCQQGYISRHLETAKRRRWGHKSGFMSRWQIANTWVWLKIKRSEGQSAGFGPCFHVPGQPILVPVLRATATSGPEIGFF